MMNRITSLFNIKYPIIQGGMVWVSGWKLASAVSNNGGLGLIGSGSMKPELLREHIQKCKSATFNSYGVNLPLLRDDAEDLAKVIIEENVKKEKLGKLILDVRNNPGGYLQEVLKILVDLVLE